MLSSVYPSKSHGRFTNEETKTQRGEIISPGPTDPGWQSLTISSTVNKYFSVGILTCLFPISLRLGARHQIFKGLRCLGTIWLGMVAVRGFLYGIFKRTAQLSFCVRPLPGLTMGKNSHRGTEARSETSSSPGP